MDENKVRQIAHNNGIKPDDISPVLSSLQSPRFLKLLIDDALDGTYTIGNPGLLLRQNIENRVKEAAAQKDGLGMNILKFSIHALLPQLEAVQDFNIAHLYNNLPMIIEDIVSSGKYYEGFEIIEYFEELRNGTGANGNIFNEFFRGPVVNTMDLMSDPSELDIATNTYIWKDRTVGDYFYAAAILHLFNAGSCEEAIRLISQLTSDLMVLEKPLLHSSVDPSVFVSFDRARYLIDIIDDSVLNKLKKTYPKEITLLYCGLSLVYELLGNEQDQYRFALAALSMLNQMYQSAYPDRGFIARWLHKMSYYVIKCDGKGLENFQDSLLSTKEYLEKAIDIAESEKPENLSTLELSKMYGNMGAYYLRKNAYPTAMDWHKKSLETKELYLSQCEPSEKEETEEGIRRSLVSLATDCFYLGKYKDSVAYHKSAIEIGKKILSFFRYESYSRIAGSYISLFNQEKSWSCEAAEELLDLLTEGIRLMGELMNRRELNIIHQHCEKILSILKANGYVLSGLKESSFFTKVCFIEDQYNMITWNTDTSLSDYFE